MHRIFFENVRCFSSRQHVPLAPLTILVGENSSGKSTVLALIRLAWDMAANLAAPNFNEEPFLLGAYDQIVSTRSEEGFFVLGADIEQAEQDAISISGRFEAKRGQPALAEISWNSSPYTITAYFEQEDQVARFTFASPSEQEQIEVPTEKPIGVSETILQAISMLESSEVGREVRGWTHLAQLVFRRHLLGLLGARPYAFAPIRTRPLRTYDPIKSVESPEGGHIPMILASTLLREPSDWAELISALDSFGYHSGLFERVEVRSLGSSESDPFQIRVRVGGKAVNLIDVGYGVSQVLPIVVDSLRGKRGGTFLLQQPEVHLHPKAQAELGSFLATLAKGQEKRFVIETHSDYLVDRIRMDIRDKKTGLRPEDVSLLYFERNNGEAQIHRLELDEQGNIVNAPPGYRSFFLEEERRFLGG